MTDRLEQLAMENIRWQQAVETARAEGHAAYHERDMLVAALSRLYPSHLCRHYPEEDNGWEDDWKWIVCVHIREERLVVFGDRINTLSNLKDRWRVVGSQATWHIHDSELPLFTHLKIWPNHWDGHSTPEKYDRLTRLQPPQQRPSWWWRFWNVL